MKNLFHILAFSFISFFTFGQVTIKTNLPSSIAPNSNLTIEIKITKGSISNFSKYQMDVPPGVTVSEGNSKTGNFSFESNRAKIVWVSIPSEDEFFVSFKMNVGALTGSKVFNQKFFYLENGSKKEVEIDSVNVTFSPSGVTSAVSFPELAGSQNANTSTPTNTTVVSNNTNTTAPTNTSNATSNNTVVVNTNTTVSAPTKTTEPTMSEKLDALSKKHSGQNDVVETKTPVKEVKQPENTTEKTVSTSGLVFRVQLASSSIAPSKAKFSAAGKVDISNEGGLFKVLYGSYSTKEEAVKKLEELRTKGLDGFVVRYQDGVRVK